MLACAASGRLNDPDCITIRAADELDADLRQLSVLVRAAKVRGDDNYIVRRGALLHGDVAMLAPESMEAPGDVRPTGGLERFRMEISDGQELDLRQSAVHWEIARMLLDFVRPRGTDRADPGHDDMVRQWYRATAAWMQLREDHDKMHLDRARALFPDDPDILFLSGSQHETYGGVPIQTAVRSAVLPTGVTFDVGSEGVELRQGGGAVSARAGGQARSRRGAACAMGACSAGWGSTRRPPPNCGAPSTADRSEQLYYGELFLGAEEAALGNREAARAGVRSRRGAVSEGAVAAVALSEMARRSGDRNGALRAIDRLFALTGEGRDEHDDPVVVVLRRAGA